MKLIDIDELDFRIKLLGKPTPKQVVDLIAEMYRELRQED